MIVSIDWLFGLSVGANLLFVGLVIYFKKGIEAYIDFRKSKALIEFQRELEERDAQKRRMQLVAELFARHFNKPEETYEFEKLNWELALFLPKDFVQEISQKLVNAKTKFEVMDLFIKIREHFGLKDGLGANQIVYIANLSSNKTPDKPKD